MPTTQEKRSQDDDQGAVAAVDDGGKPGPEPVEAGEKEGVGDTDPDQAAEEHDAVGVEGQVRKQGLAQHQ